MRGDAVACDVRTPVVRGAPIVARSVDRRGVFGAGRNGPFGFRSAERGSAA